MWSFVLWSLTVYIEGIKVGRSVYEYEAQSVQPGPFILLPFILWGCSGFDLELEHRAACR